MGGRAVSRGYTIKKARLTGYSPCWIMRTCMKQNDTSSRHVLDILHHVFEIEVRVFGIIVTVLFNF